MPLDKSGSKDSVGFNIKAEREAGKPQRQAIAIALSVQRKARGKKRAKTADGAQHAHHPPHSI